MNDRKAIISVSSNQMEDEKEEPISVVTPGLFYIKNEIYYVRYEETEISGMEGTITTLKIKSDSLTMLRKGTTNAKMEFKKGLDNVSMYDTPYGTLQITTHTKVADIFINEEGGSVHIEYDMDISGQKVPPTILDVEIKVQK
ncbi:MAG: DUF1934 domain-containing protein [Clostridium sp.]|nr:DUF1934 domain-containing protein [Clostridium sp.]